MFKLLKNLLIHGERGDIDIGGTLLMAIGFVFLSVGFIMFPILTGATDALLAYSYSANATMNAAFYTGFKSIVGLVPLLELLGYLAAGVFAMFMGVQIVRGQKSSHMNYGSMILMALSIVFVSVGYLIEPVAIDGISGVLHGGGNGINSAYSGLSSLLKMTPMLLTLAFLVGTTLTAYFGIKGSIGEG